MKDQNLKNSKVFSFYTTSLETSFLHVKIRCTQRSKSVHRLSFSHIFWAGPLFPEIFHTFLSFLHRLLSESSGSRNESHIDFCVVAKKSVWRQAVTHYFCERTIMHAYFCERTLTCQRKLGRGVEDLKVTAAKLLIRYLIPTSSTKKQFSQQGGWWVQLRVVLFKFMPRAL